jgi:hypothetical protein
MHRLRLDSMGFVVDVNFKKISETCKVRFPSWMLNDLNRRIQSSCVGLTQ